ncbi:MAG: sensor histidine kinase [Dysgonomonas sp.]
MRNFIKIFPHLLIWAIILIVPMYIMSREGTFDSRPYYFYVIKITVFIIVFYANFLYLIEKLLFNKKFISYALINIGLIALLLIFQSYLPDLLTGMPPEKAIPLEVDRPPKPHNPPFVMKVLFDYLMVFFVIGLSVAIKTTTRWYQDSIYLEKAKSVQLEADLRSLKSQLNPHFLFNTLNNIYSLIAINQEKAQEAVHRLSNLLRYVMYDNNEKFVPIDKELEFTKNYIDLMKLRLSSNVKLEVLIQSKGSTDLIASLMFMTLIENAFKHGINNIQDSFINISILVDPGKGVLCTVENSLVERENNIEDRTGIGLANLSRRLDLLYPDKHEFIAEERVESFFTLLRIDFRKTKEVS